MAQKNAVLYIGITCISLFLSGCTHKVKPTTIPKSQSSASVSIKPLKTASASTTENVDEGTDKIEQCARELNALKTFSPAKYTQYQSEYDHITKTSAQYLAVSKGISSDINDLVRPKYQYALTSLCFRIKTDLSSSLINQIKTDN